MITAANLIVGLSLLISAFMLVWRKFNDFGSKESITLVGLGFLTGFFLVAGDRITELSLGDLKISAEKDASIIKNARIDAEENLRQITELKNKINKIENDTPISTRITLNNDEIKRKQNKITYNNENIIKRKKEISDNSGNVEFEKYSLELIKSEIANFENSNTNINNEIFKLNEDNKKLEKELAR
ncbi:hypothetical protein ACH50O_13810 [Methylomonas sp. 2BW1-5-20]|uniref:hypothetical protein n=1 Tax=Methylomonas sp. 2BW1-5-20 TaxID=3376686 RepID=UPI004051C8E3